MGLISLMNSFAASAHGRRLCLLEFATFLKLKNSNKKNSSGEMQRPQMSPPRDCGLGPVYVENGDPR